MIDPQQPDPQQPDPQREDESSGSGSVAELVGLVVPVGVDPADAAPSGLGAEVVDGTVRVSWDVPVWGASEITGYRIWRRRPEAREREMSVLVADTGSAETVFVDHTALFERMRYVYRVQAIRSDTVSVRSGFAAVRPRLGMLLMLSEPRVRRRRWV